MSAISRYFRIWNVFKQYTKIICYSIESLIRLTRILTSRTETGLLENDLNGLENKDLSPIQTKMTVKCVSSSVEKRQVYHCHGMKNYFWRCSTLFYVSLQNLTSFCAKVMQSSNENKHISRKIVATVFEQYENWTLNVSIFFALSIKKFVHIRVFIVKRGERFIEQETKRKWVQDI